jgi:hypothetical protein
MSDDLFPYTEFSIERGFRRLLNLLGNGHLRRDEAVRLKPYALEIVRRFQVVPFDSPDNSVWRSISHTLREKLHRLSLETVGISFDKLALEDIVYPLRIFLCHASSDKPAVRELCGSLRGEGYNPWLDEQRLLPGQDWNLEIANAVRDAHVVLVCLSRTAINKVGYVQKEIKYALDVADQQPEGTIFIIPGKLEECDVPDRLRRWQWVNLFEQDGFDRLMGALHSRVRTIIAVESDWQDYSALS